MFKFPPYLIFKIPFPELQYNVFSDYFVFYEYFIGLNLSSVLCNLIDNPPKIFFDFFWAHFLIQEPCYES